MAEVSIDPLTPIAFLERTVRVFPNKIAVVYGDRRWTYAQFAERVGRFAGALKRAGVVPGDRVAVLAPNVPEILEAHFAVLRAGAVLVAINTRLNAAEIGYILNHSGARVVIADVELAPLVVNAPDGLSANPLLVNLQDPVAGLMGSPMDGPSFEEFVSGADVVPIAGSIEDERSLLSINYTSGTTGQPKGVMYTHRGAALNALAEIIVHDLERDSAFLWTLPLFHCNGWCFPWAVTAVGGTHVMLRAIDPAEMIELIHRENVTHFNGAPTVLLMLAEAPADADDPAGLRLASEFARTGKVTAPSPEEILSAEEAWAAAILTLETRPDDEGHRRVLELSRRAIYLSPQLLRPLARRVIVPSQNALGPNGPFASRDHNRRGSTSSSDVR